MSNNRIRNNINKSFENIQQEYNLTGGEIKDIKENLKLKNIGFQTGGFKEINNKILLQARELFPYKVDYNMKGGAKGKKSGSKKRGSKKSGSKMQGTCTKDQGSEEAKKKAFDIGVKMYNLDEKESQELKNSMEKTFREDQGCSGIQLRDVHPFVFKNYTDKYVDRRKMFIDKGVPLPDLIQKEKDKEIQQCQNKTNDFKTQIFSSMDDYRQKLELFKQDIKQNHPVCNTVTVKNEPNLLNLLLETIEKDKQIQEKVEKILAPPLPEPVPPPILEPVPLST